MRARTAPPSTNDAPNAMLATPVPWSGTSTQVRSAQRYNEMRGAAGALEPAGVVTGSEAGTPAGRPGTARWTLRRSIRASR